MLRILLLSDIHFIHCEDDENEYRSLETAFKEAMEDIRESGGVNQILICGDCLMSLLSLPLVTVCSLPVSSDRCRLLSKN